MILHRRDLRIRLGMHDLGAAVERLAVLRRDPRLRLRIRRNGRVRSRLKAQHSFDTPVVLVGRLEAGPSGVVLVGRVRESWMAASYPVIFGLTTLMMAVPAVGIIGWEEDRLHHPGLYVTVPSALLLGALTVVLSLQRAPAFDRDDQAFRAVLKVRLREAVAQPSRASRATG